MGDCMWLLWPDWFRRVRSGCMVNIQLVLLLKLRWQSVICRVWHSNTRLPPLYSCADERRYLEIGEKNIYWRSGGQCYHTTTSVSSHSTSNRFINNKFYYSVFFLIRPQKRGCCELVLWLLRSPMASMSPQDRAQSTFRSEMHLNGFNN